MAENEQDKHDRTESPTEKRLRDAREKGQIPRSRELTAAAVMLTAGIALRVTGGSMGEQLSGLVRGGLSLSRAQSMDSSQMLPLLSGQALAGLLAMAPLLVLTMVAAIGAPMMLGGWSFVTTTLVPDLSRISPGSGIGRMFSARSAAELGKTLAKFAVVATAGVIVMKGQSGQMLGLGAEPVAAAIGHAISIAGNALIALTAALILIAAIDVPFQLWQHNSELKMTKEEVKREAKEAEGSPEVRQKIRRLQRELAERRMMADVAKADVIIVNPTHYAVALRYDESRMRAPVVVAKGVDEVAARIREVGGSAQVPIFEAPPLARALHRAVRIGDEIPSNLYLVVAQVLTYVFQLRTARRDRLQPPPVPVIDFTD